MRSTARWIDDVLAAAENRFRRAIAGHPQLYEGVEDEAVGQVLAAAFTARGDHDSWEDWLASALTRLVRLALDGALDGLGGRALGRILGRYMPGRIDELLGFFVEDGIKRFADSWVHGLPMDNQMDDELWDTHFTELWLPLDRAAEAMAKLRDHYAAGGDLEEAYRRTRSYAIEVYAGGASRFWLSPGYGEPRLRLNPFWFATWAGSASDFFAWYWEELKPFGWRPHWGKHLPPPSDAWRVHYRRVLPMLEPFLQLRAALDPDQLFVSEYWRQHLGIPR